LSERIFGWGPTPTGYIFTFTDNFSFISQLKLLLSLANRGGEKRLLLHNLPVLAIGFFDISHDHTLTLLLGAHLFPVIYNSPGNLTITALTSESVSHSEYDGPLIEFQSSASLGRIGGLILAGFPLKALNKTPPSSHPEPKFFSYSSSSAIISTNSHHSYLHVIVGSKVCAQKPLRSRQG
jgi:hypothetical protein